MRLSVFVTQREYYDVKHYKVSVCMYVLTCHVHILIWLPQTQN